MKNAVIVILSCGVFAAGCNRVQSQAEELVRGQLSDPGSAEFRAVRVVRDQYGSNAVCGEVNAKNRAGGYAGFRRFMVKSGEVVMQSRDDELLAITQASHFADCLVLPPQKVSGEDREMYEEFRKD